MNKYFNRNDKVFDITENYPETIDVFVANGLDQLANPTMRKIMGKTITLEIACKTKKINLDVFEQKLIEIIEEKRNVVDDALAEPRRVENADIKVEGLLPCPVRIPLLEGFKKWIEENEEKLDCKIDYELKSANMGVDWIKEKIESNNPDSLADLFMSAGFDLFFDKTMMGKFKEQGIFEDISGLERLNKDFDNEEIDLKDPKSQYSIIGVVPAVFMVNTDELKGAPMPRTWKDLLEPEFEDSVSLPMKDFDLFNAILLNIYKNYGEEGVDKLGRTLLRSMHPAEMLKAHTKKSASIPKVTIMPYFFTKMVKSDSPLKPVWPEDGAIMSPLFLLAKKETKEQTKPIVDFLFSKEVGELLSTNGKFPSTHPEIDNGLTEDQKFMWVGWDFIEKNDIGTLIKKCEKIFHDAVSEDK